MNYLLLLLSFFFAECFPEFGSLEFTKYFFLLNLLCLFIYLIITNCIIIIFFFLKYQLKKIKGKNKIILQKKSIS